MQVLSVVIGLYQRLNRNLTIDRSSFQRIARTVTVIKLFLINLLLHRLLISNRESTEYQIQIQDLSLNRRHGFHSLEDLFKYRPKVILN